MWSASRLPRCSRLVSSAAFSTLRRGDLPRRPYSSQSGEGQGKPKPTSSPSNRKHSHDSNCRNSQKSSFSNYYVKQRAGNAPGRGGTPTAGSGGVGASGGGKSNVASRWERFVPFVFGGGVAISYLWFANTPATEARDGINNANAGERQVYTHDRVDGFSSGNGSDDRDRSRAGSTTWAGRNNGSGNSSGLAGADGLSGKEVSWMTFKNDALPTGRVSKIEVVNGVMANVYFWNETTRPQMRFNIGSVETFERNLEQAQEDLGIPPRAFIPVVYSEETALGRVLVDWLPTMMFVAAYAYFARRMGGTGGFPGTGGGGPGSGGKPGGVGRQGGAGPFSGGGIRGGGGSGLRGGSGGSSGLGGGMGGGVGGPGGGGIFNVGKANATVLNRDDNKVDVKFKDVAGLAEAKEEIMEFVQYLKKPEKYKELGAKIPKGALMHGPPGTGKTLLAKATAGEAGVPFLTMSGSDFMEMFVGVGPSRVRDLFAQARSMAPCIVFLDEIDAIGRKRGRGGFMGGNDERENTLNQLLVEMDGFASNTGVVVLAGTNRVDVLDAALLRPGRFDRQIVIDPPDIAGRREIFNVHLSRVVVSDPPGKDEVSKALAARTPGFAGADIANVCNEAALIAARNSKQSVDLEDFEAAVDRVIGGLEKNNLVMSPEEKRTVAFHEAGHAVAGWFLEHAMPLLKVSIIPRGTAALGYAQYQPLERHLYSKEALLDQMCMTLAGRASEEMFFESVTTGASDDFNKVTRMAYQIVAEWGLGKTVGRLAYGRGSGGMDDDDSFYKPYSDRTARRMDEEVRDMVGVAYERTKKLLESKREDVTQVANLLLEREAIGHEDMVRILGKRPYGSDRSSFDEILQDAGQEHRHACSTGASTDGSASKQGDVDRNEGTKQVEYASK